MKKNKEDLDEFETSINLINKKIANFKKSIDKIISDIKDV